LPVGFSADAGALSSLPQPELHQASANMTIPARPVDVRVKAEVLRVIERSVPTRAAQKLL
jgi:hypothetical protein